jgi:hypothetical protein
MVKRGTGKTLKGKSDTAKREVLRAAREKASREAIKNYNSAAAHVKGKNADIVKYEKKMNKGHKLARKSKTIHNKIMDTFNKVF